MKVRRVPMNEILIVDGFNAEIALDTVLKLSIFLKALLSSVLSKSGLTSTAHATPSDRKSVSESSPSLGVFLS